MGSGLSVRLPIVVGGLWLACVATRGQAGPPGRWYDAAAGFTATYEYQPHELEAEALPIDASFHFSDAVPTTLTATFYKPIIGALADGTPIFEIGSLLPLAVTATSNNGADFAGSLLENSQYLFNWHFAESDDGELAWSGGVGWAGGRYEETTIASVPLVPVPDSQAGDFDADGDVDGGDLLRWQSQVGATVAPRGLGADGNRDGLVDGADLALWQEHFGAPLSQSATHVPEPSGWQLAAALWMVAALVALGRANARQASSRY